jgi:hypothetical protein
MIAFAAAVAAVMLVSSLTSGWVFYVDDRVPSRSARVGMLTVDLPEGRSAGTAVLVDECGVLTNFHVVFGPWYVTALRPPSRAFPGVFTLTEATLADGSHPTARAVPVVWGDYAGADRQMRSVGNDWAYLTLDPCLGRDYGHFDLRGLDPADPDSKGERFAAIGYSSGQQKLDPSCAIDPDGATIRSGGWLHDCVLLEGDSGGPIIKRGTLTVVALGNSYLAGLNCAAGGGVPLSRWDRRCANVAVPLSWGIIDRIRAAACSVDAQRILGRLGYDAGPLGAIDEPRAAAAIRQAQRDMGWSVTGEASDGFLKVLQLRLPAK